MEKIILLLLLLIIPIANASVVTVHKDGINADRVSTVGVYFNGAVSNQTVTWLLSALYEVNNNFNNIKYVDLYINSPGGDMDAAYVAYEALKKYPRKLNIINSSLTSSAATLLYCSSQERYTLPLSIFVLHPAKIKVEGNDYVQPEELTRELQEVDIYRDKFREVYSKCTKIDEKGIDDLLFSESKRLVLDVGLAEKSGLVTKGIKTSENYAVTYFITDK